MLTQRPDIVTRLRDELLQKVGPTRRPTYDDIRDMKWRGSTTSHTSSTVAALEAANKAKDTTIKELRAALERKDEETKSLFAITQGQRAAEIRKNLDDTHSCSL